MGESTFYNENNLQTVISRLPMFTSYMKSEQVVLASINRINTTANTQCQNYAQMNFLNVQDSANAIAITHLDMAYFYMAQIFVVVMIILVMRILHCTQVKCCKPKNENILVKLIAFMTIFVPFLLGSSSAYLSLDPLSTQLDIFFYISENECFTNQNINLLFDNMYLKTSDLVYSLRTCDLALIVVNSIGFGLGFKLVKKFCLKKKEENGKRGNKTR